MSSFPFTDLDRKCISVIRGLCSDMVDAANSGHPGMPLGMAPVAHVLFARHMRFNPSNPSWINRDRFILSNGHGCALQYSMLHLTGYPDMTVDQLKHFRQVDSKTPGHPERNFTEGIEVTTGPLGQGVANGVGIAAAQHNLAARFGAELFDHKTYVFCGDGCMMEGVAMEAVSLAGHLALSGLVLIYDDNKITIDGSTDLAFTEDVAGRFVASGWEVISVDNGDEDLEAIDRALTHSRAVQTKPVLIRLRTTIGYGSTMAGQHKVHGAPLGKDKTKAMKQAMGLPENEFFYVPEDVRGVYAEAAARGRSLSEKHLALLEERAAKNAELKAMLEGRLDEISVHLPSWSTADNPVATRKASEACLQALYNSIPQLIGGSADLTPSTLTQPKGAIDFEKGNYSGRHIRFGVREHAMSAICNGIASYGYNKDVLLPYCATFLNFVGYALGAVRLSALSHLHVIYVATHDSIGLGEDGPTHQPIEIIPALRATPNLYVFRPADANETAGAYFQAVYRYRTGPSVLCLSRQDLPILAGSAAEFVGFGAYVLPVENKERGLDLVLVGTGSEVSICVDTAKLMFESAEMNVRVVSMPCMELFDQQSIEYKRSVFPEGVPVMSVEAAAVTGWHKYAHAPYGMTSFGNSGPYKHVYEKFGFTKSHLMSVGIKVISHYRSHPVPDLIDKPF